ncbi:hypothetical protein ACFFVB_00070 [Formosa undariae]|uniref:Twin-arginine translocation signal domain-containing protein n=1 Tax=Formosa undariae TaxID=1325436 RepID=A0ABV5EWA3_9FLAO
MEEENRNTEITRKEALKKMGKYAAFTAVGTFAVLSPLRAADTSVPVRPPGTSADPQENAPADSQVQSSEFINKSQVKNNF